MIDALEYPIDTFYRFLGEKELDWRVLNDLFYSAITEENFIFLADVCNVDNNETIIGLTGGFVDE